MKNLYLKKQINYINIFKFLFFIFIIIYYNILYYTMEVYGKSLIFTVFLIILLIIIERLIFKFNKNEIENNNIKQKINNNVNDKENFKNINTLVTKIYNMTPFQGDSSTLISLKGINFDFIGRIYFKNDVEKNKNNILSECVILDENRTNESLTFIPPPISELGLNINDIRDKMKKDNEGYRVSIFFARKDDKNKLKAINEKNKNNFIILPGINFYYIDKIPYANNCPTVEKPIEQTTDLLEVLPETPDYKQNGDLEFVNEILPKQIENIDKISNELKSILEKNKHYQNNDTNFIKTIQALDFLDKYKKNNNSYRYNLHKRINDRYNYNLFN